MTENTWVTFYQNKLRNFSTSCHDCECILWNGCTERGKRVNYGQIYAKILTDGDGGTFTYRTMKVHRLQYMIMLKNPSQIKEEGMHVSHLCFSHLCMEPKHLSCEPGYVNNQRENCRRDNRCYGHQGFQSCILCNCKAGNQVGTLINTRTVNILLSCQIK